MRGTLVCAMTDDDDGTALATAAEVSDRLDLRLVLAFVGDRSGQLAESVAGHAERRSGAGDAATVIGEIAAEEAADLIVVGARSRGRFRRGLDSRLAGQLGGETPVPVLIAPTKARRENGHRTAGRR
jgi:nucleotide-binding universal stress UspA family protein